jgi:hypothetical protein
MRSMSATVLMRNRNAGTHRLSNIRLRTMAAKHVHWRPLRQDWNRWRSVRSELLGRVNNIPTDDGEDGFDAAFVCFEF